MARVAVVAESVSQVPFLQELIAGKHHQVAVWDLLPDVHLEVERYDPQIVICDCDTEFPLHGGFLDRVRSALDVPILLLVPHNDDTLVVQALKCGADGCLIKPCGRSELQAHIEANIRRYWRWGAGSRNSVHDNVIIDAPSRAIIVRGNRIRLTPNEWRLLICLLDREGQVVLRGELAHAIWGARAGTISGTSLNLCVHNLRKKVEPDPAHPQFIRTKWGLGYYWSGAYDLT